MLVVASQRSNHESCLAAHNLQVFSGSCASCPLPFLHHAETYRCTPPPPTPAAPLGLLAFSLATCLFMTQQAGITESSTQVSAPH